MRKLWVDDIRLIPDETWNVVRSYPQFVKFIKKYGVPYLISFDHDLGTGSKTGYDCVKWLVDNGYQIKKFECHSSNPLGKANILALLTNWKEHYICH